MHELGFFLFARITLCIRQQLVVNVDRRPYAYNDALEYAYVNASF